MLGNVKRRYLKSQKLVLQKIKKNAAINGTKREWYDSYVLKKKKS